MKAHLGIRWLPLPAALLLALLPTSASAYPGPGRVTGDTVVHDPSMVRATDGTYLLYSTHGGLEARTSTDRIAFSRSGSAFNTPPSWWRTYSADNDPWAPDISYQGGNYLMYYAVSSFGSSNSAIGLATSPSGRAGTWTDRGIVHSTTGGSDYNAIDLLRRPGQRHTEAGRQPAELVRRLADRVLIPLPDAAPAEPALPPARRVA